MKKQVLFVDDERNILEGLQRTLRPLRGEWDTHYAMSGAEALEIMNATPIDLLITDIRMPEMDGVELLRIVMQRHPNTISAYSGEFVQLFRSKLSTHSGDVVHPIGAKRRLLLIS